MNLFKSINIIFFLIVLMVPIQAFAQESANVQKIEYLKAQVVLVEDIEKAPSDIGLELAESQLNDWQLVTVKIGSGDLRGSEYQFEHDASVYSQFDQKLSAGERIIVSYQMVNGEVKMGMVDFDRINPLLFLAVLFVVILIAIGYWIGIKSLLGFMWIGAILVWVMIPGLLSGGNVYWTIFLTAMLVIVGSSLILLGFNKKALLVIGAGLFGLMISTLLILLVGRWARFTEIGLEESHLFKISSVLSKLDLVGIFYGGMIIGALGSMMDISISIVAGVEELLNINQQKGTRKLDNKDLFKSGMNIGRDIMAVNANTLLLAYAGSAITVWIIAVSQDYDWTMLISFNRVFVELLRILAGTIGLFASIPMTAWLASRLLIFKRKMAYENDK